MLCDKFAVYAYSFSPLESCLTPTLPVVVCTQVKRAAISILKRRSFLRHINYYALKYCIYIEHSLYQRYL